jgi:hypothetical protein
MGDILFLILLFLSLILFLIGFIIYWSYFVIKRVPVLIIIPIYFFIAWLTPAGKAIDEYESFWTIQHNISKEFIPLIDANDSNPVIMYRIKQPALSATRTIFCRSIIYKLNPSYKNYLAKHTDTIRNVNTFSNFDYIGDCIGQLSKVDSSESYYLAPFLRRISNGSGSYLVYGSTKNINLANKFHSAISSVEKYAVSPKIFDGNQYNQYFIIVDEQEKMVKIIHNYNYCGFVCN